MKPELRLVDVPREQHEFARRRIGFLLSPRGLAVAKHDLLDLLAMAYAQGLSDTLEALEGRGVDLSPVGSPPRLLVTDGGFSESTQTAENGSRYHWSPGATLATRLKYFPRSTVVGDSSTPGEGTLRARLEVDVRVLKPLSRHLEARAS